MKTRTFHVLVNQQMYYAGQTDGKPHWIDTQNTAQLFDLNDKAEAAAAELLCEQHGGRFFPVTVDDET